MTNLRRSVTGVVKSVIPVNALLEISIVTSVIRRDISPKRVEANKEVVQYQKYNILAVTVMVCFLLLSLLIKDRNGTRQ